MSLQLGQLIHGGQNAMMRSQTDLPLESLPRRAHSKHHRPVQVQSLHAFVVVVVDGWQRWTLDDRQVEEEHGNHMACMSKHHQLFHVLQDYSSDKTCLTHIDCKPNCCSTKHKPLNHKPSNATEQNSLVNLTRYRPGSSHVQRRNAKEHDLTDQRPGRRCRRRTWQRKLRCQLIGVRWNTQSAMANARTQCCNVSPIHRSQCEKVTTLSGPLKPSHKVQTVSAGWHG